MPETFPSVICLFGGSFDPVHNGHLLVARAAYEELQVSKIVFVPAAQSPFKPGRMPTPAEERLKLLRLALAGKPWCEIDEDEVRRQGVSYTVETLRLYASRCPGAKLYYLIGADNVGQLDQWREAGKLAQLAEFVVIPRPSVERPRVPPGFRVRMLAGFPLSLSSSQIRDRVRSGQSIEELVPAAVAEAIRNNRLYL